MIPTKAVVITCEETPDRLAAFHGRWDALGLDLSLEEHVVHVAENPVMGCWQSHYEVLSASDGPTLVLEDDAIFATSFSLDVDVPDDWDVLYLGGRWGKHPHSDGPLYRVEHVSTTHGYVARDPHALAEIVGQPTPDSHIGYRLGWTRKIVKYIVNPQTVGQLGGVASLLTGKVRPADDFF
jgi:hypothetical protein